jgi:peptide/nickel transport system substrate-binding protein
MQDAHKRMAKALHLKVFLAGRVAVETDGVTIDEGSFPGRQGRLLFAYLVAEQGRAVPRDELAEALWGESLPATWDKALTVGVSKLRGLLTDLGLDGATALTGAFGCYRLELPEGSWVDVIVAANAVREAEEALAADALDEAKATAALAASLVQQPFLPTEEGAWVEEKRRELAGIRGRALTALADACLRSGDASEAAKWAEQAVVLAPFRETGYRRLMEAHTLAGNRAEALRVYEQCRRLLSDELGAYPSPETESIYRELLGAPAPEPRALASAPGPSAVVDEPETEARPLGTRIRVRRQAAIAIAIGSALLLTAAISVAVIEFSGGRSTLARAAANAAAVIERDTNRLVADVPVGNGPTSIAADEAAVWVTNGQDRSVSRIDRRTVAVVDRILVGSGPSGVAICGGDVWVANSLDGTVSRIDAETNDVVQAIRVGVAPTAVACGLGAVWVTGADDRSVTKIHALSGNIVYTKPTGMLGRGIAVGGGGVWVTDEASGSVVRIDPASGRVVRRVNVGNGPTGIAFGADSVWVANSLDGTVARIDPKTNTVTAVIAVGEGPDGIAVASGAVWVSVEFSGRIVRIDPAEDRVVEKIPVGNRPKGVAVFGNEVWFAVQPSGAGHRGGRLVVATDLFGTSIDPAGSHFGSSAVYDGLLGPVRRGGSEGMRIVPDLAVSPPAINAAGTRYAFQLRRGIRYSDSRPVRASDFRRAIERLFRGRWDAAIDFRPLVGAAGCERRPRRCDLSRGVRTDDTTGTIVFELERPDGEFLFNLVRGLAPVPPGTPDRDVGTRPVPSTGPYMIESYVPNRRLTLVRNPHFHVWSQVARPDGFPDEIVLGLHFKNGDAAVAAAERGQADVALAYPRARLEEIKTRFPSQLHLNPQPATYFFLFLNTRLPPFDDVRVRRAINYAVDRAAVARAQGGPELAKPFCQIRPPTIAGYRAYCPYTLDPSPTGEWKAPDLTRARRLVAASGTSGMKVTVWTFPQVERAAREVVATLEKLGYRASLKRVAPKAYFPKVLDEKTHAQAGMYGWVGSSGGPPSYVLPYFSCRSIRFGRRQTNDPSFLCDRRVDAQIARALKVQATDVDAAVRLWPRIERELMDLAPWVPLYIPQLSDFVSKRVGNYQFNPVLLILLDQLWVR